MHMLHIHIMCIYAYICVHAQLVVSNSLQPHGLYLPGSSVHGIFQAWILDQIANFFSREKKFLPNAGIKPASLDLLHWQVGSLPLAPPGKHWKPEERNQQAFFKFSVQGVWREPVNFLLLPIKKKKKQFRKPKAIKRICYWWVINYYVCWVHKLVRFLWLFIWGKKWDLKVWMITFR